MQEKKDGDIASAVQKAAVVRDIYGIFAALVISAIMILIALFSIFVILRMP